MARKTLRKGIAVVAAAMCMAAARAQASPGNALAPARNTRSSHQSRRRSRFKPRHTARKSSPRTRRHRSAGRRNRRPSTLRQRLAHMHPEPGRVEQIQRALIEAGELHEQPTGQWDAATRDAMSRYQSRNGFPVTGLPDAKSLMKLGLGPHPLPPELDSKRAALDSAASPVEASSPSSAERKSDAAPPQ
jgi:hypothetical protein